MTKGKLIIIESGSDASGKATQAQKLYERLIKENYNCMKVTFPNYDSDSSALVKMYLNGDFGKNPNDVNPYIASTFYAADRYASYKLNWEKFFNEGGIIISDRYTTSNMVHQAVKMVSNEREEFLNWLENLEFNIYKIPKPDKVIFLNVEPEISCRLMDNRLNKITGKEKKDIHESDKEYLLNSYNNALEISKRYNWDNINCTLNGNMKSIDNISQEIYLKVKEII